MLTRGIRPDFHAGIHFFKPPYAIAYGQSRVYRVTQLRTDGLHCRESAGTGAVVLKVVPVTGDAFAPINVRLFFPTKYCRLLAYDPTLDYITKRFFHW